MEEWGVLPKIEKITWQATVSHFLLMFGYKLFSLYFPLFLVAKGFSLPQVGYTYLLIYLPMAFFAPFVGFLNHKINPAVLASFGILGYAIYSLGMILIPYQTWWGVFLFYFWQVLLGIAAVLFFTSIRAILMGFSLENPGRSFGWLYSAPFYASALAPAFGALIIWQFGFFWVFFLSLVIHLFNSFFFFRSLKNKASELVEPHFPFKKYVLNFGNIFQKLKIKTLFPLILISLAALFLTGFYRAFFVLFLKNELGWSQSLILAFGAISSLAFLPLSFLAIKMLEKRKASFNIFQGGLIAGSFAVLFGSLASFLNFFSTLAIELGRDFGNLLTNAGRSGLVNRKLRKYPEEAGAIDTIFSPLGTALGAFVSGLLLGFLGFNLLFILGGGLVVVLSIIGYLWSSKRF